MQSYLNSACGYGPCSEGFGPSERCRESHSQVCYLDLPSRLVLQILGVTVMVMPVMMVVPAGCERRAGNYQQHEGGENELLHAMQISTILDGENGPKGA